MGTIPNMNPNTNLNGTEEALNRLTEVITRMMTQMQDQRRTFRPRQPGLPANQNSGIICYTCGRLGHISRQCPNTRNSSNNGPSVQTNPTQTPSVVNNSGGATSQDTLQALLNLLNNSNSTNSQSDQSSYLGIPEDDETLFLPAERHVRQKPITSTAILRKDKNGQVQDNSPGLVETEEVVNPDVEMTEGQEEPEPNYEEQLDPKASKKSSQK
ncbi:9254_t:CDS:1, partial [Gigaspora margarita]